MFLKLMGIRSDVTVGTLFTVTNGKNILDGVVDPNNISFSSWTQYRGMPEAFPHQ